MPRLTPPDPALVERRRRIGRRIQAARLHANLTQQAVAERADMDRASYQKVEYGTVSPRLDTLLRIADAIGLPLSELVRE